MRKASLSKLDKNYYFKLNYHFK